MTGDQITDWTKRTQQYWYVDGLIEIGSGAVILSVGILYFVAGLLPDKGVGAALQSIGLPVIIIGLTVLMRWIVNRLKQSITYPRTGYVAYHSPEPRKRFSRILITMAAAAGVGLIVAITGDRIDPIWIPALTGLFVALLTLVVAFRIRLTRFFILSVYPLVFGAALAFFGVRTPDNHALLFGSLGLAWMIAGSVTLIRYLKTTTPVDGTLYDGENG